MCARTNFKNLFLTILPPSMVIIPGAVMGFNHTFGGRGRTSDNAWIESFVKQLNMITSTPTPGTMNFNSKKAYVNILNTIIKKTSQLKCHLSNALNNL